MRCIVCVLRLVSNTDENRSFFKTTLQWLYRLFIDFPNWRGLVLNGRTPGGFYFDKKSNSVYSIFNTL